MSSKQEGAWSSIEPIAGDEEPDEGDRGERGREREDNSVASF